MIYNPCDSVMRARESVARWILLALGLARCCTLLHTLSQWQRRSTRTSSHHRLGCHRLLPNRLLPNCCDCHPQAYPTAR